MSCSWSTSTCFHFRVFVCVHIQEANSVAFAARRFSFVSCCPSRQPGGDRVGGGLLGHAVVADHCVEATPGVGVLGSVVGLKRSWDTPLVLWTRRLVNLFY